MGILAIQRGGGDVAHNGRQSTNLKSGWEGIYANLSLSSLVSAVEVAAKSSSTKEKRK